MKTPTPTYRHLKGYALDPGFSTQLETTRINEVIYKIKWEEVEAGPCGEYLEVIDFDPASDCFYDPVDLNDRRVLAANGLSPSEGNPKFHQQFVYAVVMKIIRHFEQALGRKVIWRNEYMLPSKNNDGKWELGFQYVKCLRIYPHAFRDANAYYDSSLQALLFGYFNAGNSIIGSNFPGGVVFTCLSPDIIAHEATHALLDSIHYLFLEDSNPDAPAFHEGFSDVVALLSRFTFKEVVEHQLSKTRGNLTDYSVLGELATQFGEANDQRGALRGAIGFKDPKTGKWKRHEPNPKAYRTQFECHDRGAIFVATIFDAFIRLYNHRTQDLLRIATGGTGKLPEGSISVDLVKRLADEAGEISEHLLHICIRALDYCPPMDITFGNYLRALITADLDVAPEDENGYRIALIEAFRARGIFPNRVNTLSEESLRWNKPSFTEDEDEIMSYMAAVLHRQIGMLVALEDRKQIFEFSIDIRENFEKEFEKQSAEFSDKATWESFLNKLGLTRETITFTYNKKKYSIPAPKIKAHQIRPAFRTGREKTLLQQVVITLIQIAKFEADGQEVEFHGGCTLILNLAALNQMVRSKDCDTDNLEFAAFQRLGLSGKNVVEYAIIKNICSGSRFDKERKYRESGNLMGFVADNSTYNDDCSIEPINFSKLHFH